MKGLETETRIDATDQAFLEFDPHAEREDTQAKQQRSGALLPPPNG